MTLLQWTRMKSLWNELRAIQNHRIRPHHRSVVPPYSRQECRDSAGDSRPMGIDAHGATLQGFHLGIGLGVTGSID